MLNRHLQACRGKLCFPQQLHMHVDHLPEQSSAANCTQTPYHAVPAPPQLPAPCSHQLQCGRGTPCIQRGRRRTWGQAPGRRLGLAEARFYAAGVALALDYLHSRGVLYRCAAGFPQPARAARGSRHALQMAHTVFSKC